MIGIPTSTNGNLELNPRADADRRVFSVLFYC